MSWGRGLGRRWIALSSLYLLEVSRILKRVPFFLASLFGDLSPSRYLYKVFLVKLHFKIYIVGCFYGKIAKLTKELLKRCWDQYTTLIFTDIQLLFSGICNSDFHGYTTLISFHGYCETIAVMNNWWTYFLCMTIRKGFRLPLQLTSTDVIRGFDEIAVS